MRLNDTAWQKWRLVKYPSIRTKAELEALGVPEGFGSESEPDSSLWLASLSEGLGDFFKEGMKVLDYGCGNARYCNFISERLGDFTYYGVEPPGSPLSDAAIENGRKAYNRPYVKLGFIGDDVEAEALATVDAVVLGSIFTHLLFDEFHKICDKFKPILDRGGKVVFSVFIDQFYRWQLPNTAYAHSECYSAVWYTENQLKNYCQKNKYALELKETFPAGAGHKILCMYKPG